MSEIEKITKKEYDEAIDEYDVIEWYLLQMIEGVGKFEDFREQNTGFNFSYRDVFSTEDLQKILLFLFLASESIKSDKQEYVDTHDAIE